MNEPNTEPSEWARQIDKGNQRVADLNRRVAEKVMGWTCVKREYGDGPEFERIEVYLTRGGLFARAVDGWKPMTDLRDAWTVRNELAQHPFRLEYLSDRNLWVANIGYQPVNDVTDTPTSAICLAALRAVGAR